MPYDRNERGRDGRPDPSIVTTRDLHRFMDELSSMAAGLLRQQWNAQSIQPSDLVQSAFRRQGFKDQRLDELTWKNKKHFFGAMHQAMKRALLDHAKKRSADKRQAAEDLLQERQLHDESPERLAVLDEDLEKRRHWKITQVGDLELRDLKRTLEDSPEQVLALIDAIDELEQKDPEGAEVIQHRIFEGLTLEQTAQLMEVSVKTVQRKWDRAWTWLNREVLSRVKKTR